MKSITSKINQNKLWFAILLLALTLPSRLVNIDRAINIDEPFWLISSSNFYYAVTHRDFENTYFELQRFVFLYQTKFHQVPHL